MMTNLVVLEFLLVFDEDDIEVRRVALSGFMVNQNVVELADSFL